MDNNKKLVSEPHAKRTKHRQETYEYSIKCDSRNRTSASIPTLSGSVSCVSALVSLFFSLPVPWRFTLLIDYTQQRERGRAAAQQAIASYSSSSSSWSFGRSIIILKAL
jgi:hypothetical protein